MDKMYVFLRFALCTVVVVGVIASFMVHGAPIAAIVLATIALYAVAYPRVEDHSHNHCDHIRDIDEKQRVTKQCCWCGHLWSGDPYSECEAHSTLGHGSRAKYDKVA